MKSCLLWDRFLSHWRPPDKATGDVERDIDEALRAEYELPDGKKGTFAQKGGTSTIVITGERTEVDSRIPPCVVPLPSWLVERPPGAAFLGGAIRGLLAEPRPHVILKTGRRPFTLDGIVPGDGTAVVVNEPDGVWSVDSVRVGRARRALKALGSAGRAKKARKLLDDRIEAMGDTDGIDKQLRTTIGKLKIDRAAFFDALDLLEGVTPLELKIAGEGP